MKHKALLLTLISVASVMVGCDKPQTASEQLDKVQEKTAEVAKDVKDYTFAQKAEFSESMRIEMAAIGKELDQLQSKIDKSSDAVKAEAGPKLQALRDQAAQLNKQLDAVNSATESTWETVKTATKNAYESLKEGFQQSRQWVSEKIAP